MIGEEKNLKDSTGDFGLVVTDTSLSISYTKTNKLITALYMVTDIVETSEPLRNKLRTSGTDIISDIRSAPFGAINKISDIVSFLDIASAMNIISEMNANILKKEFTELKNSIAELYSKNGPKNQPINLSDFFKTEVSSSDLPAISSSLISNGHPRSNSIGIQKGSTLLSALNGVRMSDRKVNRGHVDDFELLKKERRQDIINLIKNMGGNATIKDIKDKAKTSPDKSEFLAYCSEKTLQRELVSMLKDNVLKKTGEKRWSRYFLTKKAL